MWREISNFDLRSAGGPPCFYQVGVDAIVATLTNIANYAIDSDLVDVTSAQLGHLYFCNSLELLHGASPPSFSLSGRVR